ncbi:MAG: hypothetical protein ACRDFR_03590 [Candidatus Limnocylindria bacterium]
MSHDDIERALRGAGPREAGESPRPLPRSLAEAGSDLRAIERRRLVPRALRMTMGVAAAGAVLVVAVVLAASFLRLPSSQLGGNPSGGPARSPADSTPLASLEGSAICGFFAEGGPESMITTPATIPAIAFPTTLEPGYWREAIDATNQFAERVSGEQRDDVLALAAALDAVEAAWDEAVMSYESATDQTALNEALQEALDEALGGESGPQAFYVKYGPPCGQPLPVVDCGPVDQATCDAAVAGLVAGEAEGPYAPPVPMPVTRVNLSGDCSTEVVWIWPYGVHADGLCGGANPQPTPTAIVGSPQVGVPYQVIVHCTIDLPLGDTWWRFENAGPTPGPVVSDLRGSVPAIVTLTSPDTAILRAVDGSELMLSRVDEPIEASCFGV